MKSRPILYGAPMVRAVLGDTKTQTRRIATLTAGGHVKEPGGHRRWHPADPEAVLACPYGQPGDRLWVRECYSGPHFMTGVPPREWIPGTPIWFWADGRIPTHGDWTKPKPGIHMPRWASRITLEITGVRVERLQDISEADARAEGIEKTATGFWSLYGQAETDGTYSPIASYRALWESINGPGSWDANPWVWVIEFRRLP